jgi:glycosyltransferase involved in cell wall biosynthesis
VACAQLAGLGREIRPISDVAALAALVREVRAFRPHVVHTHTAKAGLLGRLAARLAGVPVVVHTFHGHVLHGYFGPVKNAVFRSLERALARSTDRIVAVSEAVRDDLVRYAVAPAARIHVVPLGLDLAPLAGALPKGALRGAAGVAAEAPLVGIVGRLVPIKDVGTFLSAAARVGAVRSDVRFAIVGDGEERAALEGLARELGLAEVVHFHGWQRQMGDVYGDLDVVVNCSLNEGTPVALIEALAASRPVVATAVGGTPEVLGGGAYGALVAAGDAEALARAILETLAQPESAARRARAGRHVVLSRYSVERLLDDMDGLYRELLGARRLAA